jgi:hypothetical protein
MCWSDVSLRYARHNNIATRMVIILGFLSLIVENEMNLGIRAFMCLFGYYSWICVFDCRK